MKQQFLVLLAGVIFLFSCKKESTNEDNGYSPVIAENFKKVVPLKGSYNTSLSVLQPPPNMVQQVSGTGVSSVLGRSTFEATANVSVTSQPPFTVTGTRIITAANGDQLFTTFTGTSTPVVNGLNGADLQDVITGGTGRFVNASGSFTSTARNNFITSVFTAEFDGFIEF